MGTGLKGVPEAEALHYSAEVTNPPSPAGLQVVEGRQNRARSCDNNHSQGLRIVDSIDVGVYTWRTWIRGRMVLA